MQKSLHNQERSSTGAHVLVSTNKWFSAVNESCLQLALHLQDSGASVLCLSHRESPLQALWSTRSLRTAILPLLGGGPTGWLKAWRSLSKHLLQEHQGNRQAPDSRRRPVDNLVDNFVDNSTSPYVVWVFEGREHTLCSIHRLLRPRLWKPWTLVRMRGQAAPVRNTVFNRFVYVQGIDVLVCAAAVIAERIPFFVALPRAFTFLFCSRSIREAAALAPGQAPRSRAVLLSVLCVSQPPAPLPFLPDTPAIDSALPLFVLVGRFDSVKGHASLIEAVARVLDSSVTSAELTPERPLQIAFVGKSENIHAHDLARRAGELWNGRVIGHAKRLYVEAFGGRVRLFLFDEKRADVASLMARAHFGLIPSLASEVICRVAVEFLQCGTPLVTSTAGALSEVVPSDASFSFPPSDASALATALGRALATIGTSAHDQMRERAFATGWGLYSDNHYADLVARVGRAYYPLALSIKEPD